MGNIVQKFTRMKKASHTGSDSDSESDGPNEPHASASIAESESDSEADGPNIPHVSYDRELQAQHTYLDYELARRNNLDDDMCENVLLIDMPEGLLVPGQTLPLYFYEPHKISMMMNLIKEDKTFGLVASSYNDRLLDVSISRDSYGVTAEICSHQQQKDDYNFQNITLLKIIATCRQRIYVKEVRWQSDGTAIGNVRILHDLDVDDPGSGIRLQSLEKFRSPVSNATETTNIRDPQCTKLLHRCNQRGNLYEFANYTAIPQFVYKLCDPHILMRKITSIIENWNCCGLSDVTLPTDPKLFSYWVATNIPISDEQEIKLLLTDEFVQRLRLELRMIDEQGAICCRRCLTVLGKQQDVFKANSDPETYRKKNGFVHEMLTIAKVSNLRLIGKPSTKMTWFPGYAYVEANCITCDHLIGWKYVRQSKKLKPARIWGLRRNMIVCKEDDAFA